MQTKNLESGRVLVVAKQNRSERFSLGFNDPCTLYYYYDSSHGVFDHRSIPLPPGQWQLLGIGSEITSEQWERLIPELNCRERYPNYCGDYPIWFHSRIESLHSLIRSLGYEPEKCIVLFEPKK